MYLYNTFYMTIYNDYLHKTLALLGRSCYRDNTTDLVVQVFYVSSHYR